MVSKYTDTIFLLPCMDVAAFVSAGWRLLCGLKGHLGLHCIAGTQKAETLKLLAL